MALPLVAGISRVAKDDSGLLPQPDVSKYHTAIVQIFVRSQPYGGSDKSSNGHRYDSIPFANGMINAGISCQLIHYTHEEHDAFFEVCKQFDALIVRCNPGHIKSDGGDQQKFDNGMRELRKLGIQVWPSPDVMEFMGSKDALTKVAKLNIGLEDTLAYYTPEEFVEGFKKTMAFQPRVIKQNRGSAGEGIWIIKLKAGNYCGAYGERSVGDDEVLVLMEANDNHEEIHTVAEFVEFCIHGRTEKSGSWTSKGVGKYLEGGKDAGGQLIDQRFCPRIVEGELRYNMVGDALVGIIHKKPKEGGISAVGGTGSVYTYYGPDEPLFAGLTDSFQNHDLKLVMPALGLKDEPLPLWWTADFINSSPAGTPPEQEKWIVGEFNCSCVGISKCLAAYCKDDTPNASFGDISAEDLKEAMVYGNLMGTKALGFLVAAKTRRQVDLITDTLDFMGVKKVVPDAVTLKTGYICNIDVFTLTLLDNSERRLVVKTSNLGNALADTAEKLGMYEKEALFYSKFSALVSSAIKVPKWLGNFRDHRDISICLDDLSVLKGRFGLDLNNRTSLLMRVVADAAAMHSMFRFEKPETVINSFRVLDKVSDITHYTTLVRQKFPLFLERCTPHMLPQQTTIVTFIAKNFEKIVAHLSSFPMSFCHGDLKSPNIFYENDNTPYYLDWQYIHLGKGVSDIVFLCVESLKFDAQLVEMALTYYYRLMLDAKFEYSKDEFNKDVNCSLCCFPFFVAVWFNTEDPAKLIDTAFPLRFLQGLLKYYDHFLTEDFFNKL